MENAFKPLTFQMKAKGQRLCLRMNGFDRFMIRYVIFKLDDQELAFLPDPLDHAIVRLGDARDITAVEHIRFDLFQQQTDPFLFTPE